MAVRAAALRPELKEHGWPRWVAALSRGIASEVPGHRRMALGPARAERRLNLFCQLGEPEPLVAATGSCAVVLEGFLYNGADLAGELGTDEADDAETILRAYERWGEDLLNRLRGIFALVVWDASRDLLLCARDAMGNHPLFFSSGAGDLIVSTSLEAVVRHPSVSRAINRAAVTSYFLDFFPKLGETFYAEAERVPPGHALAVSRGERRVYRYWNPQAPKLGSGWVTEDEVERFNELLSRAVERSLEFGPLGIYLSGGLDSVSIAAVATDLSRERGVPAPRALSLIFSTPEANEERVQKAVGERLGLEHDLVPFSVAVGSRGILGPAVEMSAHSPHPLQNYLLSAYNYLASLGQQNGCRAILTGTGGDEWLGVSPFLAADLIGSLDVVGLYRLWNQTRRSFRVGQCAYAFRLLWSFGLRTLLRDTTLRTLERRSPSTFARIKRNRLRRLLQPWQRVDAELWSSVSSRVEAVETDRIRGLAECGTYFAEVHRALDHPLVSWEMEELFENGKRLGLRFLHPYFDRDLVELLYRTPPALLNRGGLTKGLVRQTVAKRFPGLGFDQQKKVQLTKFFPSVIRAEGAEVWKRLGGAKALIALGLAEPQQVDSWVSTVFQSDHHPKAFRVWQMMSMESWLRARL